LSQDPWLGNLEDPVPLLQIFAHRYCIGQVAPSGSPVKARTVEVALRFVVQTFASLGQRDPRLQASGRLDFRLHRQLQAYTKADPPPTRVKPIPLQVLQIAITQCYRTQLPDAHAIAHMLILGFFFLLHPGEYAYTDNADASPFRLCGKHLIVMNRRLNPLTCSDTDLQDTNFVGLHFTTQKNGVRGEIVGLGRSGHPVLCPVHAMITHVTHLRLYHAIPTTPIYATYTHRGWTNISTSTLTQHLHIALSAIQYEVGITPADISVRSLRASGAMALLCAEVDIDKIRLLGRWRSDEMLRYLHVQAFPIAAPLASQMVRHGFYSFFPNNNMG
jgi:hypothetical protein